MRVTAGARETHQQRPRCRVAPCRIEGAPFKEAMDWIDQYKQFWEARFDRLDAYLLTLKPTDERKGE